MQDVSGTVIPLQRQSIFAFASLKLHWTLILRSCMAARRLPFVISLVLRDGRPRPWQLDHHV